MYFKFLRLLKINKNFKIFDPCVGKCSFLIDIIDFLMNN